MKKLFRRIVTTIIALSMFPGLSFAACTGSSPTWTTTPDYASVSACVAGATSGDTINITAGDGSETWDDQLVITQGINLIGPGRDVLTIVSDYDGDSSSKGETNEASYIIKYKPITPANREPFRLSGFTLDLDSRCGGILLVNDTANTATTIPHQIRIDNMTITNAFLESHHWPGIIIKNMWGVIDNNIIDNCYNTVFWGIDSNWTEDGLDHMTFGDSNHMYFEDNVINIYTKDATVNSSSGATSYVSRYNTVIYTPDDSLAPIFDLHGDFDNHDNGIPGGTCSQFGGFGVEVYGNKFSPTYNIGNRVVDIRGGRNLIFFNRSDTDGATTSYFNEEEDGNCFEPTVTPFPASGSQPMYVNQSYFWNVRRKTTLITPSNGTVEGVTHPLVVNEDYWYHNASYGDNADRSQSGVYCGTTKPLKCNVGDAAWITTQSCDTVADANVGVNPETPISGVLWKCTSQDTWTEYYRPYTYPHPLRGHGKKIAGGSISGGSF